MSKTDQPPEFVYFSSPVYSIEIPERVDDGVEPFRFIHFNLQTVRKMIIDTVRNTVKEKI